MQFGVVGLVIDSEHFNQQQKCCGKRCNQLISVHDLETQGIVGGCRVYIECNRVPTDVVPVILRENNGKKL